MNGSLILVFVFASSLLAEQGSGPIDRWQGLRFLIGEWKGQGTGRPGDGSGGFVLDEELDGKVLIRRNHADYPPRDGRPASHHEDLMIVYPAPGGTPLRAIYFDNEGHTIEYTIKSATAPNQAVFNSAGGERSPRFRLTYQETQPGKISIRFEISPPGRNSKFQTYIEANATRTGAPKQK
jgi:hypothetical protein